MQAETHHHHPHHHAQTAQKGPDMLRSDFHAADAQVVFFDEDAAEAFVQTAIAELQGDEDLLKSVGFVFAAIPVFPVRLARRTPIMLSKMGL